MNSRLAVLFLSIVCLGCPKRLDFGPQGEITDPEALLRLVTDAEKQVLTLKGEAKVQVESPQGKGAAGLFVAISRPTLIHFEALDFFNRPQAVLVSNGERFGLFSAQENQYLVGPASAQNVSRLLPVVLPPGELVAILLGQAPRIPAEHSALRLDEESRSYVLTLQRGSVTQTLWIHPLHHRVTRSEIRGVEAFDLELGDFEKAPGGVVYPRRLVLTAASAGTRLELRYRDVELNQAPDLTMFDLEAPPNTPVVEVDAQGRPVQGAPASAP